MISGDLEGPLSSQGFRNLMQSLEPRLWLYDARCLDGSPLSEDYHLNMISYFQRLRRAPPAPYDSFVIACDTTM